MDAIILAGGRGKRMGALTAKRNKGALPYQGQALVVRVVGRVLALGIVDTIYVAIGYNNTSIRHLVTRSFDDECTDGKIRFVDAPEIKGDFKRMMHTIKTHDLAGPCLVCGIDVLIPHSVAKIFAASAASMGDADLTLLASPNLTVAPTHSLLKIEDGIVREYVRPAEGQEQKTGTGWFSFVGNYLISPRLIADMRNDPPLQDNGIVHSSQRVWRLGGTVRAVIFEERWHHFACVRDLAKAAA